MRERNKIGALIMEKICGICDKPESQHFRGGYCYENTQERFSSEPNDLTLISHLRFNHPDLYESLVNEWKYGNGHSNVLVKVNVPL